MLMLSCIINVKTNSGICNCIEGKIGPSISNSDNELSFRLECTIKGGVPSAQYKMYFVKSQIISILNF